MKYFGIITTALPARGSKRISSSYVPSLTWRLFHLAGRKYQLNVIFFRAEDVDFEQRRVHAWSCSSNDGLTGWRRQWHPLPDVVYENCFLHLVARNPRILAVKHKFTRMGIPVFNPGLYNKSGFHHVLSKSSELQPFLPASITVKSFQDVKSFLERHRVIFLKPVNGSGGAGILRLKKLDDHRIQVKSERFHKGQPFYKIFAYSDFKQFITNQISKRVYLAQKGLSLLKKDKHKIDFRVVVHRDVSGNWQSAGIRPKLGKVGSIVTNSHAGGMKTTWARLVQWSNESGMTLPLPEQLDYPALLVAKHLTQFRPTLSHLGIDIAVDLTGNIYVLDINGRPGRDLLTKEMFVKVADYTAGFASYLLKNKK